MNRMTQNPTACNTHKNTPRVRETPTPGRRDWEGGRYINTISEYNIGEAGGRCPRRGPGPGTPQTTTRPRTNRSRVRPMRPDTYVLYLCAPHPRAPLPGAAAQAGSSTPHSVHSVQRALPRLATRPPLPLSAGRFSARSSRRGGGSAKRAPALAGACCRQKPAAASASHAAPAPRSAPTASAAAAEKRGSKARAQSSSRAASGSAGGDGSEASASASACSTAARLVSILTTASSVRPPWPPPGLPWLWERLWERGSSWLGSA